MFYYLRYAEYFECEQNWLYSQIPVMVDDLVDVVDTRARSWEGGHGKINDMIFQLHCWPDELMVGFGLRFGKGLFLGFSEVGLVSSWTNGGEKWWRRSGEGTSLRKASLVVGVDGEGWTLTMGSVA